ncbi:MAG: rhamnulokinase [Ruminiclostridium sp.]|nr:rhamnulokinase [Ruminiclostridium sp.]
MLNLLAFDYGASSGRAMLGKFDGNRLELSEIHRFANEPVMVGDSLYWDILRLFHEMKQGILKCAAGGCKDMASIGIDTWGVDFGLLDSAGKLLGNPYHYRDGNTGGMIEEVCRIVPGREIYARTGIAFQVFNSLYQIFSMKFYKSPLLEKASTMLFTPDLLRYFLTGEKSCEYTIASTSQMLDAYTRTWAVDLLDKLGIPQNILTGIIDAGTIAGKLASGVAGELGIGQIPVVAVAEHDTGSAVVSVPAVEGRYAFLSSGTWSLLGVESAVPFINDSIFNLNYTNEGGYNKTTRLLKNIMGLWIYQECKRTWDKSGEAVSFDELEQGAANSEAFTSFIDPDDSSFFSPGKMPVKVQEYCRKTGQKIPETKPQIVRCIMESFAMTYRETLEGLEKVIGYTLPVLHIVGGGCKNTMLSQFTANAISRPVITGPVEATATGNLMAQLLALGEVKSLNEGRLIIRGSFPTAEYSPENKAGWDAAYERFLNVRKR